MDGFVLLINVCLGGSQEVVWKILVFLSAIAIWFPAQGATTHSVTCTAYSIGDNHTPKTGLTASGTRPRHNWTVAVSRDLEKHFPMGSTLYIEGVGICRVEDRMHRRIKNRIDVYKRTPRLAKQWGIRKVLLKKGN